MTSLKTWIFSISFFVYVTYSVWSLVTIFRAPGCDPGTLCFNSYLNKKPPLELSVFLTETAKSYKGNLIFHLENFDYDQPFERDLTINLPESTRKNGSLFIHVLVLTSRKNKKPSLPLNEAMYQPNSVHLRKRLTRYSIPKSQTFNLLQDETKKNSILPVTHLKGKFAVTICTDDLSISQSNMPMEIFRLIRINQEREILPILQQDFMQTRLKDLIEITPTSEVMTFSFSYAPSSIGKLRFLLQIEATLTQFLSLGFSEKDLDEVKGVFADTNLYLLCATICIGSIHLLFDFLSFKNDVSFWKSNSSMAGLSTRTVVWRAFSQTVVFLFLLDEGTSMLVVIPSGIATMIEFWKVKKVLKISISFEGGFLHIQLDRYNQETQEEARTREYDEECMRYLSYLLYPLCVGAAVYSLLYQPHKSWYSWTINSLVNGVYAFGFLFMLPQLFVNYRLKSVAALPWRAFMYRAFNTFIDDIFAFIITMPTAHRVACFRDDIIFIIYLYQRWLYPVDKRRSDDHTCAEITDKKEDKKTK